MRRACSPSSAPPRDTFQAHRSRLAIELRRRRLRAGGCARAAARGRRGAAAPSAAALFTPDLASHAARG
ncbi:hypothetical protein WS73_13745 [Burkholderia savannae]|nr:hypothetical protein WS73_13745 [Burkholderia savannae]